MDLGIYSMGARRTWLSLLGGGGWGDHYRNPFHRPEYTAA